MSADTAPAVEARGLEKWYGPQPAVRGIEFELMPGEFVTVFGPNGAGKTTLLRILTGAARPTRGAVLVAGEDPSEAAARRGIGNMPAVPRGEVSDAEMQQIADYLAAGPHGGAK